MGPLARNSLVWSCFKGTLQMISVLSFWNSASSYFIEDIPSTVSFSKAGIGIIYSTKVQKQEIQKWFMIQTLHKKQGGKFCLGRKKTVSLSCFATIDHKAALCSIYAQLIGVNKQKSSMRTWKVLWGHAPWPLFIFLF